MKSSMAALAFLWCFSVGALSRDPFEPPVDRCPWAQWDKWRFHGVVGGASSIRALLENPEGKWLRVYVGQPLSEALQVREIDADGITIAVPANCEPGDIRWQRKEKYNDKDVQISRSAVAATGRIGGKTGK